MDVIPDLLMALDAGCQRLQAQALGQAQLLFSALSASEQPCHATRGGNGWAAKTLAFTSLTLSGPVYRLGAFLSPSNAHAGSTPTPLSAPSDAPVPVPAFCWRSSCGRRPLPLSSMTVGAVGGGCGTCINTSGSSSSASVSGDVGSERGGERRGPGQLLVDLSGTWIRDRERSDSMEEAMNLMRLNGIVRQAVKLVRGVQIAQDPEHFTFTVFSAIAFFKVKEVYPWSGEERQYRRRDLRRGKAQGRVEPHGQQVHVRLRWSDPLGGHGTDHFRLVTPDELHIESVIQVAGQTAKYLTVYSRKGSDGNKQRQQQQRIREGSDEGGSDPGSDESSSSSSSTDSGSSEEGRY